MDIPTRMEVDTPSMSGQASEADPSGDDLMLNPLKRSNSAPMINALTDMPIPSSSTSPSETDMLASSSGLKPLERVRRFSTSSMALNSPTQTPIKGPSRLIQIKNEESVTQEREVAHERETQSAMQLSQSMEEIFVDETMNTNHPPPQPAPPLHPPVSNTPVTERRPKSLGEPLHIHVSQYYPYASSPSPTRIGKQCFSPSLQQPVYRTGALTPSPSPSPTRKTFASPLSRRSLSPITLRPSPLGNLGTKRKMDLDGEKMDTFSSPAKRFHASSSPGGSTPDRGHIMYHQLIHSVSSSSIDACNSPEQRVPNNLSTGGTVSNTSCHSSFFRPVRESTESRCTDSEASDMTETTDISEQTDLSSSHLSNLSHMSESGLADTSSAPSSSGTTVTATVSSLSPCMQSYVSSSSPGSSSQPSSASSSSLPPSVSSMSPQLSSSASSSSSSSSLPLTQNLSSMSVSQVQPAAQTASRATPVTSMSNPSGNSVQFFTQSSKVTQV